MQIEKDTPLAIIDADVIHFDSSLAGMHVKCLGKECRLAVESTRKSSSQDSLSYYMESTEHNGVQFVNFTMTTTNDTIFLHIDTQRFPEQSVLIIHLNVYLNAMDSKFDLKFDADLGSLDLLGVSRIFDVHSKVTVGSIYCQDVHLTHIDLNTGAGNLELVSSLVSESIMMHAKSGDISINAQFDDSIFNPKIASLTTDVGKISGFISFYTLLIVENRAGQIYLDCQPSLNSKMRKGKITTKTKIMSDVGDIDLKMVFYF